MGFKKWAARKGAVGGTARWAAKGYFWFDRRNTDYSITDLCTALIENRFMDRNKKSELLNTVSELNGLLDLVIAVLDVEAGFSENTFKNQKVFIRIIVEEFFKAGVPQQVVLKIPELSSPDSENEEPSIANSSIYPFTPNMPDVSVSDSEEMWEHGTYVLYLAKDVPTLGERMLGVESPIRYESVMAILDAATARPYYYITLESGITGKSFLCAFGRSGEHLNFGPVKEDYSDYDFAVDAMDIFEREFEVQKAA